MNSTNTTRDRSNRGARTPIAAAGIDHGATRVMVAVRHPGGPADWHRVVVTIDDLISSTALDARRRTRLPRLGSGLLEPRDEEGRHTLVSISAWSDTGGAGITKLVADREWAGLVFTDVPPEGESNFILRNYFLPSHPMTDAEHDVVAPRCAKDMKARCAALADGETPMEVGPIAKMLVGDVVDVDRIIREEGFPDWRESDPAYDNHGFDEEAMWRLEIEREPWASRNDAHDIADEIAHHVIFQSGGILQTDLPRLRVALHRKFEAGGHAPPRGLESALKVGDVIAQEVGGRLKELGITVLPLPLKLHQQFVLVHVKARDGASK